LYINNASGKGVRQEKETFAKEIEMTLARAQSSPVATGSFGELNPQTKLQAPPKVKREAL